VRKQLNHELRWLLLVVLTSLFIGYLAQQVYFCLSLGLASYIFYHYRQVRRLTHWIERPSAEPPQLRGMWEEMACRVLRIRRRSIARKEKIANLLKRYQQSTQSLPDATILLNQYPDENSFMTSPYIYIDSSGLLSDNPDSPKNRVPWTPSQTDMFAEDWCLV